MTNGNVSSIPRKMDLIDSLLDYTSGIASPEIFRLWSALGLVSGLLEKRVWVQTAGEFLFPNLFILLVAPPGVGKTQAIKVTADFWQKVPEIHVAPDDLTKASFIDNLNKATRNIVVSPIELDEFNSMQIAADELGVLLSAHDLSFLSVLNKIFDCPAEYKEDRRMFKDANTIHNPQISILAGTQPGFMASIFPEEAWGMGFTSRLIMVYSASAIDIELFDTPAKSVPKHKELLEEMKGVMKLHGGFRWEQDAKEAVRFWNKEGKKKTNPEHTKLEHYTQRRIMHLLKLMMISSVSHSNDLIIRVKDFDRALTWLVQAEVTMPDVFRNMTQKSDAQTIQELHFYAWQIYAKEKKPIHEARLIHFLQTKVPSDRVEKILQIAERAGFFKRMAGALDTYTPAAKNATGVE